MSTLLLSVWESWDWVEDEAALLVGLSRLIIALGLVCSWTLLLISAPYGRYSSAQWGPSLPSRPAWFIQELPALVLPLYFTFSSSSHQMNQPANQALMAMLVLHYTHRALIFPMLICGGKPYPVVTLVLGVAFCGCNGYLQGCFLGRYASYPTFWLQDPRFLMGLLLFGTGMTINIHSDHILRNLRKPGEKGYKIPQGGMFEYVSGANFLGEMIEWWGFALASYSLPALAFAIFTTCNIGPRALSHHRWYLDKFGEKYPAARKALLPYLL